MTADSRGKNAATRSGAPSRTPLTLAARAALLWAAVGAALIVALSQIPASHRVDVGALDAAYVQGFHDAETAEGTGGSATARWTRDSSALLFPQAGLPGEVTFTLRGPDESARVELAVLLNGTTELVRREVTPDWVTFSVPIATGTLKATDFFLELRATTTTLPDGRAVGVLVDKAVYTVGPGAVTPYPTQVLYGALLGGLLGVLLRPRTKDQGPRTNDRAAGLWPLVSGLWSPAFGLLAYGLAWLLLYRLQPPLYPYPLRTLPLWAVGGLGALVVLRDGPALAARWPRLVSMLAPLVVVGAWIAVTLLAAQGHVTLSRPGVESDFRVFATRETLEQIFDADGFYNLGYPLLLWLVRPFVDGNAFLAGRLVAAFSGAVLLAAGYWLARGLMPPGPALAALLILTLSGLVAQYGLYVGSDMPFAACVGLCVAALVGGCGRMAALQSSGGAKHRPDRPARTVGRGGALMLIALAGLFGGAAFLIRHLGLVLLPWGVLLILLAGIKQSGTEVTAATSPGGLMAYRLQAAVAFALTFLVAMAPQVATNLAQTGDPLYNQQAKNIWLAVYAGTDWGRWEDAPNTIGLAEVVLRDPARFLANWWRNMVGYLGSGAEDTSEFGRAIQLRLLGFPANWLAVGALLWWLVARGRDQRPKTKDQGRQTMALLLLIAIYVAAVSTAFTLPRFFLPLAPIYAGAAGWALWRLTGGGRTLLGVAMVLGVVLWGGYAAGTRYVLANQPAEEVAIVAMVNAAAPPEALIAARVSGRLPVAKYSAIAHRVVEWPAGGTLARPISAADLAEARAAGASYLLWDEAAGTPPLDAPEAARVAGSGRYTVYVLGSQ